MMRYIDSCSSVPYFQRYYCCQDVAVRVAVHPPRWFTAVTMTLTPDGAAELFTSTTGRALPITGHLRVTGRRRDTGHRRDSGRRGTGPHRGRDHRQGRDRRALADLRAADHRALADLRAASRREHGHRAQHRAQHRAHHQEVADREGAARKCSARVLPKRKTTDR